MTIPYISILLNVIALCNYEINHLQQAANKVKKSVTSGKYSKQEKLRLSFAEEQF